jgi:penicillin-binding protein 2
MSYKPTAKRDLMGVFNRRVLVLGGVGAGAMAAIGARLGYLQTQDFVDKEYTRAADSNRYDAHPIVPRRGVIYDRFGVELAITSPDYRVSIRPENAKDGVEETIRRVASYVNMSEAAILRRLRDVRSKRKFDDVLIKNGLTWDEYAAINVRLPELPGVIVEVGQQRFYPYTAAFAHPIGYVQKPNQREVDRVEQEDRFAAGLGPKAMPGERFESPRARYLRNPDVRVGKAGLEAALEDELRGEPGVALVEVNASGRTVREDFRETKAPKRGSPIITTIDAELQRMAMERMSGESAACVVMDIWDGDLIILGSSPGFDPNQFVNGIGAAAFKELNEDKYKPLFHKCVTGAYHPGSTFKLVTGAAVVEAGIDPKWRVNCPGFFPFGGRNFHCWKKGGHGSVDLHDAIKLSCDVYFYQASLRAGPQRIADIARIMGLGQKHDIGVPAIVAGVIPDPDWWRKIGRGRWTQGLTLNSAIGQGDIVCSPLQLAVMTARFANGGLGVIPRLVRESGAPRPLVQPKKLPLGDKARELVLSGMNGVSNEPGGTAYAKNRMALVRDPATGRVIESEGAPPGASEVQIAGKTGTAQVRVITAAERLRGVKRNEDLDWELRDHAIFVCYGPVDAPRYACAVVVEHGGGGSAVAAPIARDVMRGVLLADPSARKAKTIAALETREPKRA